MTRAKLRYLITIAARLPRTVYGGVIDGVFKHTSFKVKRGQKR